MTHGQIVKSKVGKESIEVLLEKYYGRMNDCSVGTFLKSPCGDEMEIYLDIENNKIMDIKIFTIGCEYTKSCGVIMAKMVHGLDIYKAMDISAKDILDNCPVMPSGHTHCGILAAGVLYKAIAVFSLEKDS